MFIRCLFASFSSSLVVNDRHFLSFLSILFRPPQLGYNVYFQQHGVCTRPPLKKMSFQPRRRAVLSPPPTNNLQLFRLDHLSRRRLRWYTRMHARIRHTTVAQRQREWRRKPCPPSTVAIDLTITPPSAKSALASKPSPKVARHEQHVVHDGWIVLPQSVF